MVLSQIPQFVNMYIYTYILMHPMVHIYVRHPMVYRFVCMYYWVHKDASSSATSCDLPFIFYDSACDYVNYRHYADKTSHISFIKSYGIPTKLTKTLTLSVCHTLTYMYTVTHMHTHYEVQYNLQSTLLSCEESISRPYFSARMLAIHPKH